MSRILLIVIVAIASLGAVTVQADQLQYRDDITPTRFNDVWGKHFDSDLELRFDPSDNTIYVYSAGSIQVDGFSLDRDQREQLIARIAKYIEWNDKAVAKQVKLEKEIGTVDTSLSFWKWGDEWSYDRSASITAYFFSQNPDYHQMVLMFEKLTDQGNEFMTHKPDALYFDMDDAKQLRDALSANAILEFLDTSRKQQELEDEFQ